MPIIIFVDQLSKDIADLHQRWCGSHRESKWRLSRLLDAARQHKKRQGKKRKQKGRRRTSVEKPLTTKQADALTLWSKHNGDISKVAVELNISRASVYSRMKAVWIKLPQLTKPSPSGRIKTQTLSADKRGQSTESKDRRL